MSIPTPFSKLKLIGVLAAIVATLGLIGVAAYQTQRANNAETLQTSTKERLDKVENEASTDRKAFKIQMEAQAAELAKSEARAHAAELTVAGSVERERTLRNEVAGNSRRLQELLDANKDAAVWRAQRVPDSVLVSLRQSLEEARAERAAPGGSHPVPRSGGSAGAVPAVSAETTASIF